MASVEIGINPSAFTFEAPTENTDGSAVKGPLSYNVYRSDTEVIDIANGAFFVLVASLNPDGTYTAPLDLFPEGRTVFALTATDIEGDESDLSNTMGFSITDGIAPKAPVLLPA